MNENIALEGPRLPKEPANAINLTFPASVMRGSTKKSDGILVNLVDGTTIACADVTCAFDVDGYVIGDVVASDVREVTQPDVPGPMNPVVLNAVVTTFALLSARRAAEPLPPVYQEAFDSMRSAVLSWPARMAQGIKWEGEDGRGAMFGSSEYLNRMLWANLGEQTPEEIEAARACANERDVVDRALAAHLAAAPKLWCVTQGRWEDYEVKAIYPTEEAARADLPRYAHLDDVEVASLPFFPA